MFLINAVVDVIQANLELSIVVSQIVFNGDIQIPLKIVWRSGVFLQEIRDSPVKGISHAEDDEWLRVEFGDLLGRDRAAEIVWALLHDQVGGVGVGVVG